MTEIIDWIDLKRLDKGLQSCSVFWSPLCQLAQFAQSALVGSPQVPLQLH